MHDGLLENKAAPEYVKYSILYDQRMCKAKSMPVRKGKCSYEELHKIGISSTSFN